jgi:L-threonylcarbamoyladenylate synthase
VQLNTSSNPKAPGQLKSHYAPRKRLVLGNITELLQTFGPYNVGILVFNQHRPEVVKENQLILSAEGNLEDAAHQLFSALRQFDKMPVQVILAEEVPERGLGRAINDRLRRAAG